MVTRIPHGVGEDIGLPAADISPYSDSGIHAHTRGTGLRGESARRFSSMDEIYLKCDAVNTWSLCVSTTAAGVERARGFYVCDTGCL